MSILKNKYFFARSAGVLCIGLVFLCSYSQASAFSFSEISDFFTSSSTLADWWQNWFNGGGGSGAPCTDASNNTPAVIQDVAGYAPASLFTLYPDPNGNFGRAPGVTNFIESWYDGMVSPGRCDGFDMGTCLSPDFPSPQGVRIAAITAKPEVTNVKPSPEVLIFPPTLLDQTLNKEVGVDIVSFQKRDSCGVPVTHWGYETAPTPTATAQSVTVPKDTPVDVTYSCQPNQAVHWRSSQPCVVIFGIKIGQCNVRDHVRTFLFSNQFSTNIPSSTPVLSGSTTFVAEGNQTYDLTCGGYKQENGTTDSPEPPLHNYVSSSGGVCIFGIDCNTGGDTGTYGVADPSYKHPGLTLSVTACTNDNEIVVKNTCTPCDTIKAGSHRSGNICIINAAPRETIDAGKGDGVSVTVPLGTVLPITATFTPGDGDSLVATAINDNSTGSSVSCSNVLPSSTTCWQQPDPQKVYTYTPTTLGTKTFSAQIKTVAYANYGSNKSLSVTAVCPASSTPSGANACKCTTAFYTWVGSSCVLQCPKDMVPNGSGSCMNAPKLPTADTILFTATRVRSGNPSTLSFTVPNMKNGITCSISPTPTEGQISWNGQAAWVGTAHTAPITAATNYTLSCTNTIETVQKTVTVQLVPQFEEI
jgi:hypothetical protein